MIGVLVLLAIIILIQLVSMNRRLSIVESRLGIESAPTPPAHHTEALIPTTVNTTNQKTSITDSPGQSSDANLSSTTSSFLSLSRGITWFRHDTLLKIGAFFLLLGFGWLVTYAFLNNWIDEIGRITLGLLAGVGLVGFGFFRIRKFPDQGSVFLGLGAAILLLSTYAARYQYDLLTPFIALAFVYLVSVFVSFTSYHFRLRSLAFLGLVIGSLSPLLTNGRDDHVGLFAYLLVITVGTLWLSMATAWRELTTAALIVVMFYSLPFLLSQPWDMESLTIFSFIFAAIFFITNILNILRSENSDGKAEMITAFINATLLLLWIRRGVSPEWQSLVIATWMIVFSGGSFIVSRYSERYNTFLVYAGISIAYLATATAVELDGTILTIAFTAEALAISLIAYHLTHRQSLSEALSLLLFVPILLSLQSIGDDAWYNRIPWNHFSALLFLALSLGGLGYRFLMLTPDSTDRISLGRFWLYGGTVYLYTLLWLSFHALLSHDTATMVSLITYTLIGLAAFIIGKRDSRQNVKIYGIALLGFVIFHLLMIDVWSMDLVGRIVTFFIVGILLMSTTFIKPKQLKTSLP